MGHTRALLILAFLAGVASAEPPAGGATSSESVPKESLDAVRAALPEGWSASAKGDKLVVRRKNPVSLYNPIGAPPGPEGEPRKLAAPWPYEVTLRFRPLVSEKEYAQLNKKNAEVEGKVEKLRDGLRAAGIRHKFDDWLPETPEQKKLVEEYRVTQKGIRRLPDLYTPSHSIEFGDSVGFVLLFAEEDERRECEKVKADVRKLFKAYRAEKDDR
jgi:hypothetical protein